MIAGFDDGIVVRRGERTLPLPPFSSSGDLPIGVHHATFSEIRARLGTETPQRRRLCLRLDRIHAVARDTGHLSRMVVFGSFVTTKAEPNDVDVFLLMADTFDVSTVKNEALLLFDHLAAQARFGASVFWLR